MGRGLVDVLDQGADPEGVRESTAAFREALRLTSTALSMLPCDPELTRVKIHETLAEWADVSGLRDLMKLLGDGRSRVRSGVVASLSKIGDRNALVPLLRLHALEGPVSSSGEQEMKAAFREIVRREGVGRDDTLFARLKEEERATLERLYPSKLKTSNGNGSSPTVRVNGK